MGDHDIHHVGIAEGGGGGRGGGENIEENREIGNGV